MATLYTCKRTEEIPIKISILTNIIVWNQKEMNVNKLVEKHDFGWKVIGGRVYQPKKAKSIWQITIMLININYY